MNCSRCEFAAKIKDAEHSGIRYEDAPCASCQLKENSLYTLEFKEGRASVRIRWPPPEEEAVTDLLPVSVLVEAVKGFLEMPQRTFRIVQRRMKGDSYALIARELEVTPQAVEVRLKRALEKHPHLKSLMPGKARRQKARKRKMRSMVRRGKPCGGVKKEGGLPIQRN